MVRLKMPRQSIREKKKKLPKIPLRFFLFLLFTLLLFYSVLFIFLIACLFSKE